MVLPTLEEFKSIFQNRFSDSFSFKNHERYGNSELGLDIGGERYVLSLQARKGYESTDSFGKKLWYAKKETAETFIPIFLIGTGNQFIFKYTGFMDRIANCNENAGDVYKVQEKVKLVSREQEEKIVVYNPSESTLKVLSAVKVYAKTNYPSGGLADPLGSHSSDAKFEKSELERALHLNVLSKITLENLCLGHGEFQEKKITKPVQLRLL